MPVDIRITRALSLVNKHRILTLSSSKSGQTLSSREPGSVRPSLVGKRRVVKQPISSMRVSIQGSVEPTVIGISHMAINSLFCLVQAYICFAGPNTGISHVIRIRI